MKILFFIYTLSGGGAERVTATLASHWADKGWDVTIVSVSAGGHDEYEVAPGGRRIALDMAGKSSSISALWEDLFNECLRDKHCLTRSARAGTQRIDGASHEY